MKKLILLAGIAAIAAMPVSVYAQSTPGGSGNAGNNGNGTIPGHSNGNGGGDGGNGGSNGGGGGGGGGGDHGGGGGHGGGYGGGNDTGSSSLKEKVDVDIEYDNELSASIDVDVEYDKRTSLRGDVYLRGYININSSAVAVSDPKQLIENNEVNSSAVNKADVGSVKGEGNVGVNSAAGTLNQQANIGTIASAPGGDLNSRDNGPSRKGQDDKEQGNSGWAEANTVSLQKVYGNEFNLGRDAKAGNNTANVTSVSGSGNIGVNAAAGAFNAQENVLTMAVVKDGALAEANAGIMQVSWDNTINSGGTNNASVGSVDGRGNIGVNAAAGVGNIQSNSLTIAVSESGRH